MVREALRERLISTLQQLGGKAGNSRLLAELGWKEETYQGVQQALIEEGELVKGRGRGGSVRLSSYQPPAEQPKPHTRRQKPSLDTEAPKSKISRNQAGKAMPKETGAQIDYRVTLWAAADKLRGNMDAAEYKHVALGLIFLKYISDRFEERKQEAYDDPDTSPELAKELADERDWYKAESVFWVPPRARWDYLKGRATSVEPTIGALLDQAMIELESENSTLKGVLTKNYARPELDQTKLGEVVKLFSDITFQDENHGQDILGRVYEYFLGQFAISEGKRGGQFYTAGCVVELLVEMLQPFKGRVYDPCCGSGGMFVQSERFVQAHNGERNDVSVFGQESNPTTWRLAKMNLAIRGIEANLGVKWADTFHEDLHSGLKADFILANPPFNDSDWGGEKLRTGNRWDYGPPPIGNANFAWVQHFIHHLAPHGTAGFVLANGSLSSQQSGEGLIRQKIIERDLVDCIVSLPGQLFFTTQIPVSLWFISRDKSNGLVRDKNLRDRRNETLFIDARGLGSMESRTLKVLSKDDIRKISTTYHNWRETGNRYIDEPGFCKSAATKNIASHDYTLNPSLYVGRKPNIIDNEDIDKKMHLLINQLRANMAECEELDQRVEKALQGVGYGW